MKTLEEKIVSKKGILNRTTISFWIFNLFILGFMFGWVWLHKQPSDGAFGAGIKQPLRTVLDKNEKFFNKWVSDNHLAKKYPLSAAVKNVRVNGDIGLKGEFDPSTWELYVIKAKGDSLVLKLDDIKKLPKTEIVFDFKCIEGWDQVTHWGGVKFSDFVKAYNLTDESAMKYLGLSTPDEEYYVGIDMPSALHPQTLLCYEMNGKPLPMDQGYPLRLIIPVKYGIKSLKRIGSMYFDNERPPDYWFERGYDYFSGL
jgi:DMSO/TMAO reductase YedYZ molybdopterin-dependent catalytic subunit